MSRSKTAAKLTGSLDGISLNSVQLPPQRACLLLGSRGHRVQALQRVEPAQIAGPVHRHPKEPPSPGMFRNVQPALFRLMCIHTGLPKLT
jgi:hypothetical protein